MFKHFGPMLRCENQPDIKHSSITSCSNEKCSQHGLAKKNQFCDICGHTVSSISINKTETKIDRWQLSEDIQEALYHLSNPLAGPLVDFWAPNLQRGSVRTFSLNRYDHVLDINLNPEEEKEWFLKNFSKEIQTLKDRYGEDKVSVVWGMVSGED